MATRKPARSAKKTAKAAKTAAPRPGNKTAARTAKQAKPARVAKQAAKAEKTVESARAAKTAQTPEPRRSASSGVAPGASARPLAADAGDHGFARAASIERGITGLRKRLRAPSRTLMTRRRTGPAQDPDRLDAALKQLCDRYRNLLEQVRKTPTPTGT